MPQQLEEIRSPIFAGHETFTLRYGWLKKSVDAVVDDPEVFGRDDALTTLGVGKNMVRSIRHWALVTGVLEEEPASRGRRLRATAMGRLIFADDGIDPFLEDSGTLWLLHYLLAGSPSGPTTWYWALNHYAGHAFSADRIVSELATLAERHGWNRVAESTLRRDVHCFIRTYAASRESKTVPLEDTLDCPLTELGLLHAVDGERSYAFVRGEHRSLPTHIFAFALLLFWDTYAAKRSTLLFDEIAYAARSPGRVFKLGESAVMGYLEALDGVTGGKLGYDVTAGLMQVYRRGSVDPVDLLTSHAC